MAQLTRKVANKYLCIYRSGRTCFYVAINETYELEGFLYWRLLMVIGLVHEVRLLKEGRN